MKKNYPNHQKKIKINNKWIIPKKWNKNESRHNKNKVGPKFLNLITTKIFYLWLFVYEFGVFIKQLVVICFIILKNSCGFRSMWVFLIKNDRLSIKFIYSNKNITHVVTLHKQNSEKLYWRLWEKSILTSQHWYADCLKRIPL